jgi:hypothetical protein
VRASKIGSSLTTEHHDITGRRPPALVRLRGLMAHRALMAHISPAEIRVQGHLVRIVRLVRTFFQRDSGPFGQP